MSLFLNLVKTFEKSSSVVGIVPTEDDKPEVRKTLLPLFHSTFKTQICVIIDGIGNFISISRDDNEYIIIAPFSEKSASRSSGIAAHPLCDQLAYVDNSLVPDRFSDYIKELSAWKADNPKLNAIATFLKNNSICSIMLQEALFKENELSSKTDESGNHIPYFDKIAKIGVRFSVQIAGDKTPNVWEDKNLQDMWVSYQSELAGEASGFDYLCGKKFTQLAQNHPKNINNRTGNAKLISCNDTSGYTFRGRFNTQDEAVQIDALTSQQAHQALRWLIANQGVFTENQVTVIWAADKHTVQDVSPFDSSFKMYEIFKDKEDFKTESDILTEAGLEVERNYAKTVADALKGFARGDKIKQHKRKIIIAIFDAATTGRMGVTFYQEFPEDKYLENIAKWHSESAWHITAFKKQTIKNAKGKDAEQFVPVDCISCPSFLDILEAVYGKRKGKNDTNYDVLKKKVEKQLMECMFGNFALPESFVKMSAIRASKPLSFDISDYSNLHSDWRRTINVACALTKKYLKDKEGVEISMELEEKRNDRDYLYGRLLAVADKLELDALYKANKTDDQKRPTNAIRLMNSFSVKPFATWGVIWKQLLPYKTQLLGASYHQNIIDDIMVQFKAGDFESNKPLSPLYLLGYSAQNRTFSHKNKKGKENLKDENITE